MITEISIIIITVVLLLLIVAVPIGLKVYRKGIHIWILPYLRQRLGRKSGRSAVRPVHIIVAIVDHYEPGNGKVDLERARRRVKEWVTRYPKMAAGHRDADGVPPQHTWFYPPHYHESDHLAQIVSLCKCGFGEVELHIHHDHHPPFPETGDSLRQKVLGTIEAYSKYGVWGTLDDQKLYGFIHGNWALANSAGGRHCGVNNELSILRESGCYADFTYPAPDRCQPRQVNRIYYADCNGNGPKSHNTGLPVHCGGKNSNSLMIIQGPLGIRWKGRPFLSKPCIETAEIDHTNLPVPARIDHWVNTAIHIEGKPEWVFIKLHCHGAPENDHESLIGKHADQMFSYLEENYNDGKRYVLHYVTAREMYNIIKAGEAGQEGSPNQYRNYLVKRPAYDQVPNEAIGYDRENRFDPVKFLKANHANTEDG